MMCLNPNKRMDLKSVEDSQWLNENVSTSNEVLIYLSDTLKKLNIFAKLQQDSLDDSQVSTQADSHEDISKASTISSNLIDSNSSINIFRKGEKNYLSKSINCSKKSDNNFKKIQK